MRFAFSNSRLRDIGKFLPARLMKNWTMRTAEPSPFGLTFLLAIVLATVSASLVKASFGGKVETVFTLDDHRRSAPLAWLEALERRGPFREVERRFRGVRARFDLLAMILIPLRRNGVLVGRESNSRAT
jgi:hypothetical protein